MASTSLTQAEVELAMKFSAGRFKFEDHNPGCRLLVTCTYRSVEEQQRLYSQGRTAPGQIVTQIDGVTHKSNHNYSPSRAIDFAVTRDGKITWDTEWYKVAGPYFVAEGLIWGGNWKTFKDYPHVELP
jgi:peptidoglycan L-alanyl-D-glutamate endopeptidase CwlK